MEQLKKLMSLEAKMRTSLLPHFFGLNIRHDITKLEITDLDTQYPPDIPAGYKFVSFQSSPDVFIRYEGSSDHP